ncbi:MAG: hypothetical protein QGI24_01100 [Kiritimatiellia bacterium]|nr:hypothetical protein [Kiritimatiellia bacterium]MDP6847358.1 hypothetical protein [Kiritimatiellia bacterium]
MRIMKTNFTYYMLASLVIMVLVAPLSTKAEHVLGLGLRHHALHSVYEELPYDDGDVSYGFSYEFHEENAYWQLALDYAPELTGTNKVDHALTPQLNLMFKDSFWRAGLGIMSTYMVYEDDSDNEDDWTDIYYQFLAGISIPLGSLSIDIMGGYVFEDWGELDEFDFDDMDVIGWLKYAF